MLSLAVLYDNLYMVKQFTSYLEEWKIHGIKRKKIVQPTSQPGMAGGRWGDWCQNQMTPKEWRLQ